MALVLLPCQVVWFANDFWLSLHMFIGGLMEFGESWENCAARELMEECGIEGGRNILWKWLIFLLLLSAKNWSPTFVCNSLFEKEGKHHVAIIMKADVEDGVVAENREPHKCEGWSWWSMDEVCAIENKFLTLERLCEAYKEKRWDFQTVLASSSNWGGCNNQNTSLLLDSFAKRLQKL